MFLLAFRPFFLGASLWSAVALCLWVGMFLYGWTLPIRLDPLTWHVHEMLFAFGLAAIAGFLLTAIPNWTGRPPITGGALAALVLLWVAGRVVALVGALVPFWLTVVVDVAFPVFLCTIAAREILLARNWRNLAMPLPIAVLAIADLLLYLESGGFAVPAGLGWRLGLAAILILVTAIGGRIIPTFTRNWLIKQSATALPATHEAIDSMALGLLHAGLIGWVFLPARWPIGLLLIAGAILNLVRLARWRGFMTVRAPILLVLHIAYLWLPLGAGLLGASMLTPAVPLSAALHALTAGAIGTMILAVMPRVSLGHTGRPITADGITNLMSGMVVAAAAIRVVASFPSDLTPTLLTISAGLWIASFLLFILRYGPMLVRPRIA